jgi:hypothetical protein
MLKQLDELLARLRRLEDFGSSSVLAADDDRQFQNSGNQEENTVVRMGEGDAQNEGKLPSSIQPPEQGSVGVSSDKLGSHECVSVTGSPTHPPLAAQQTDVASESDDPDEAWKTFLFGDQASDELEKAAFEEARQDAARLLRPSDSSTYSDEKPDSQHHSNLATAGSLYAYDDETTSDSTGGRLPNDNSASMQVAPSNSPAGTDLPPMLDSSDGICQAPSLEVNADHSIGLVPLSSTDVSCATGSISAHDVESRGLSSDADASTTTSMAVVPPRSNCGVSEASAQVDHFRFAPPKLFVGRRSDSRVAKKAGLGIGLTKRQRGRPRKRAGDGRVDIRALPNYTSDPIEDFEDKTQQPKSIFPALELA